MAYKYERWTEEHNLERIKGWARDGLTMEEIAHNMGVAASTLHRWQNDHEQIREALQIGRDVAEIGRAHV